MSNVTFAATGTLVRAVRAARLGFTLAEPWPGDQPYAFASLARSRANAQ